MNLVTADILKQLRRGPRSSVELAQASAVSQSTAFRAIRSLERNQQVVRIGKTRGARYALLRTVHDTIGSHWPIYRIDSAGTVHEIGTLFALQADSYYTDGGPHRMQQLSAVLFT